MHCIHLKPHLVKKLRNQIHVRAKSLFQNLFQMIQVILQFFFFFSCNLKNMALTAKNGVFTFSSENGKKYVFLLLQNEIHFFTFNSKCGFRYIYALGGSMWPPYSTNMNKITHRQAAIDSTMPCEFKKWN